MLQKRKFQSIFVIALICWLAGFLPGCEQEEVKAKAKQAVMPEQKETTKVGSVEKNMAAFEEYKHLEYQIDRCLNVISEIEYVEPVYNDSYPPTIHYRSYFDIQDNLGEYLVKNIGKQIVELIKAEIKALRKKQTELKIDCSED